MAPKRTLPSFTLGGGDGHERPFQELLADFNILTIRRVPVPSHGPATKLLWSLLAQNRGAGDETVRGFDIRSPDRFCETCSVSRIVFQGEHLVTICDSSGAIYRRFGVVGDDRFFVIGSDRRVIDAGSIREIARLGMRLGLDGAPSRHRIARAPPEQHQAGSRQIVFDARSPTCRTSN
ncbi:MAG: hypothetical protein ACE5HE_00540 [Phycisphaerae bacterium]